MDVILRFAVKSGGHARFAGASNANGGVTIDLVRFDEIKLAEDKNSVMIGAGNRWGRVYRKLEENNLTVIGGRGASVGVGGLILGGRHGLACDNVLSYEIVLPSAEVTTVSQTQHPDLFKALKGAGSGNFGIVTSFNMTIIPLPNPLGIWCSSRIYSWDKVPVLGRLRRHWVTKGVQDDFDTGGYQVFGFAGMYNMSMAVVQHYHTSHPTAETWPAVFAQYQEIERLPMEGLDAQVIMPMSEAIKQAAYTNPYATRNSFGTFTYQPTEELDEAIFAIFEEGVEKIKHVPGIVALMGFQPLFKQAISKMSLRGGNSLGLKESDEGLVISLQTWRWDREDDDALVFATIQDIVRKSEKKAKEMGLWHPYKYINYAEDWQGDVYEGYGEDNLRTLKALQRKYDPEGLFTKGGLCGGYFRLNDKVEKTSRDKDEL
ncbi:hypothetical protein FKW77_007619 [Venturia effusa]|uniref:FAD-binding PCMH-type domain-containing protein n=1 Tax=Venturia effusa TaxID=50376 RepID=A0A517KZS7_9PEZI|nr:hypothetical protein FKW77_007619 [Venturia effusa]